MRDHRSRSVNCSTVSRKVAKKAAIRVERAARPVPLTVRAADRHSGASGMVGLSTNRLQQQWATGDRLAVMVRIGQTHEQVPPVEDEGENACHDPAARQVVGGKSAPAPVVLQLVEAVLTISSVPVKLPNGQNLGLQRGHQNSIFPGFLALLVDLDKAERQLSIRLRLSDHHSGQTAAEQDDAPLPAPAHQADLAVLALPAGPGITPIVI